MNTWTDEWIEKRLDEITDKYGDWFPYWGVFSLVQEMRDAMQAELADHKTVLAWAQLMYQTANKAIDNRAFSDKDIEGEFFYHLHGAPKDVQQALTLNCAELLVAVQADIAEGEHGRE